MRMAKYHYSRTRIDNMSNTNISRLFEGISLEVQNGGESPSADIPPNMLEPFATPSIEISCSSDSSTRLVSVGIFYRIINSGTRFSSWHD